MQTTFSKAIDELITNLERTFNITPFRDDEPENNISESLQPSQMDTIKEYATSFINNLNISDTDKTKILRVIQSTNNPYTLMTKLSLMSS